jgi:HD superfamily phosphohydrolase
VSEEVFEELTGRANIHETLSAAIVTKDPTVSNLLGDEVAQWISDLFLHQGSALRRTVERDIVSGPADIDKLDYLLRDSHYCGVNYGKYDLSKIVESCRSFAEERGDAYLAFNEDGIYALEEMLLARYHMHRQVYGHKTRVGIDRMLVRAMLHGVDEGLLDRDIFSPPEEIPTEFVQSYLKWDDARVVRSLTQASDGSVAGQLMRALVARRLCKRVIRLEANQLNAKFGETNAAWIAHAPKEILRDKIPPLEEEIASLAGTESHWVILHWEDRKSQVSFPGDARISSKDILIMSPDLPLLPFHGRWSEIFTHDSVPSEKSISLYLGTNEGADPHEFDIPSIIEALYRGLEEIGEAARAL